MMECCGVDGRLIEAEPVGSGRRFVEAPTGIEVSRAISTAWLNMLPCVDLPPINLVVFQGS